MLLTMPEARTYIADMAEQDKVDVAIITKLNEKQEHLNYGQFKFLFICLMLEKLPDENIFKFTLDIIWKNKKKISTMSTEELLQLSKELKAIAAFITKFEISDLLVVQI
jgi:hypothetical protein